MYVAEPSRTIARTFSAVQRVPVLVTSLEFIVFLQ